jgi:hypothetical protein
VRHRPCISAHQVDDRLGVDMGVRVQCLEHG